jgi:hypothetical protein
VLAACCAGAISLPARALSYVDTFDTGVIDPAWWTLTATGGSSVVAANARIELTQGSAGFASIALVPPVSGDFDVRVDYVLLEWPPRNLENAALNAYASPGNQLLVERTSNPQYDGTGVGEVYLADFTGQGILGTPTGHRSGTLRLQREGDRVRGFFLDDTGWTLLGTYEQPGEAGLSRLIGLGLFGAADPPTAGVKVAFDNFALNAPIPEPRTQALWLAGLAVLLLRASRGLR